MNEETPPHAANGVPCSIAAGGHSDTGPVRAGNEDGLLIDPALGLFAVADGMGGHRAGEVASHLALATLAEDIAASGAAAFPWPQGRDESLSACANQLRHAVRRANARVFAAGEGDPDLSGMGTTLTALMVGPAQIAIASVGDSRAYLVRDGHTAQLTRDDTWLVSVLGLDGARDAAARAHPMRHVLTSMIGAREPATPEVVLVETRPGDVFVLTTDGVHNVVDDETIGRLAALDAPEAAAQRLVSEAITRRTTDNVTAVVVRTG